MDKNKLNELLLEAQKKARHAREVKGTEGYKDFTEWADQVGRPSNVVINGLDDLIRFTAHSLMAAGINRAVAYFDLVQEDVKTLEAELQILEQSDLDEQSLLDE